MDQQSEGEARALDRRCRPTSPASRTAVIKLRALPLASQTYCIVNYVGCDLPHLVRCAIDAGISPDTLCVCGELHTPVLSIAAQRGNERALKALLVGRANHALVDKQGCTAAHQAAHHGRTGCLRLLLNAGAEKDARAENGYSPLYAAARQGHAECCSLLLAVGSEANTRLETLDSVGETPLISAMCRMHMSCVRVLLPASDLSITIHQGLTVFHCCVQIGNLECFELLLPRIRDVDVRTVAG